MPSSLGAYENGTESVFDLGNGLTRGLVVSEGLRCNTEGGEDMVCGNKEASMRFVDRTASL